MIRRFRTLIAKKIAPWMIELSPPRFCDDESDPAGTGPFGF